MLSKRVCRSDDAALYRSVESVWADRDAVCHGTKCDLHHGENW